MDKIKKPDATGTQNLKKMALWRKIVFSLIPAALFFGLLEAGLFVAGVQPVLYQEDPFVGFSANVPLFVEKTASQGRKIMQTAKNKLSHFNYQTFSEKKRKGTYRIFCLGGSTTFGRPYDDSVSFSGWLRELLPLAGPEKTWEVINAGGISYASYRVARLMKELVQYEPDLFIIYSGHNEFLEHRSYQTLRDAGGILSSAAGLLAHTRTWTIIVRLLRRAGALNKSNSSHLNTLPGEVDTLLENYGPKSYKRDDDQREQIVQHYRFNLERMAAMAKAAGADVIFVIPAANIKDCSPFKSEHTPGLNEALRAQSEMSLTEALAQSRSEKWPEALKTLEKAIALDPRFAEHHYRLGKILFNLERKVESKTAFQRALEEDVCSLRVLSSMRTALSEVAMKESLHAVNLPYVLEQRLRIEQGHTIAGKEYFLDHVHLTVKGNRILAEELIKAMTAQGILTPSGDWGNRAVAAVEKKLMMRVDKKMQALGLSNLAQVLAWSGKIDEAGRLAEQALKFNVENSHVTKTAADVLALQYSMEGKVDLAWSYYLKALEADPNDPRLHFKIGHWIMDTQSLQKEIGIAHILRASVFWSGEGRDRTHLLLGTAMAERGRHTDALAHFLEARRINPGNIFAGQAIQQMQSRLGGIPENIILQKVTLKKYPSGTVSRIVQVKPDKSGRYLADGFWTEWHESGALKRFVEYVRGIKTTTDLTWDKNGKAVAAPQAIKGF